MNQFENVMLGSLAMSCVDADIKTKQKTSVLGSFSFNTLFKSQVRSSLTQDKSLKIVYMLHRQELKIEEYTCVFVHHQHKCESSVYDVL